ncbi:alkylhydroperoxidase/carboxymuconolactone decarboxylase family protein YurZ [Acinetobacter calcoaceticus]|uniref:Alkylhydroperoxidase/carboxymuconolactone decarboxylase family protein YurZ n=1 Tax=Acinetobacter calcoaceticus TaxID=471 RepID=A0A4R1XR76_ACICA|nr:alkylhydroperoxidase/carboxymuconolactone decarboxylase family protein YurZ [Acinetobacter calcoaceticus]
MQNTPNYNALRAEGLFDAALDPLAAWSPEWTETWMGLVQESQLSQVLEPKLVALIRLTIDVTATHLYAVGVRRHIRSALKLGLSRAEILEVFKLASVIGIHACALGVPILQQELADAGHVADDKPLAERPIATPVCDLMRAQGQFNPLWETLYDWDPDYLEKFLDMATEVWKNGILPALWIELLCIAGDATITHMWAHGTRRHMQAALRLGATHAQILEVLKIVSLQGIESCEFGVALLDESIKQSVA